MVQDGSEQTQLPPTPTGQVVGRENSPQAQKALARRCTEMQAT